MLGGEPRQLHSGGDVQLPEDVAQVKGDGVRAEEHLAGHLAVAEPLRDQVDDAPLGIGQAVPPEGWPVRPLPVMQPDPGRTQPGPDPGHAVGAAELLVLRVRLPQPGHRGSLLALFGDGKGRVLSSPGAAERSRIPPGG